MSTTPLRAHLYVIAQFTLIAVIAFLGGVPERIPEQAALAAGMALGIWAVVSMRRHIRAIPVPSAGAPLLTTGPYRRIRHPMYTAVLLATAAWAMGSAVPAVAFGLWALLLGVLLLKLRYEERLLIAHYGKSYRTYMSRTARLIPFVF